MSEQPNIVLVHGAWADGPCWSGVIRILQEAGYNVTAPQFPLTALADDVARLRQVLAAQSGPILVAGHSGMVSHPDEVAGLIQTAAQSVV